MISSSYSVASPSPIVRALPAVRPAVSVCALSELAFVSFQRVRVQLPGRTSWRSTVVVRRSSKLDSRRDHRSGMSNSRTLNKTSSLSRHRVTQGLAQQVSTHRAMSSRAQEARSNSRVILWFRDDLRLHDNPAVHAALTRVKEQKAAEVGCARHASLHCRRTLHGSCMRALTVST